MRTQRYYEEIKLGRAEDTWDSLLFDLCGVQSRVADGEKSWGFEAEAGLSEVKNLHDRAVARRMEIAERMTQIVEDEKALAKEERQKRTEQRFQTRRAERGQEEHETRPSPPPRTIEALEKMDPSLDEPQTTHGHITSTIMDVNRRERNAVLSKSKTATPAKAPRLKPPRIS